MNMFSSSPVLQYFNYLPYKNFKEYSLKKTPKVVSQILYLPFNCLTYINCV